MRRAIVIFQTRLLTALPSTIVVHFYLDPQRYKLGLDPDTEALLEEMMSDGLPEAYDDPFTRECTGVQDIIITGEVRPLPSPIAWLYAYTDY